MKIRSGFVSNSSSSSFIVSDKGYFKTVKDVAIYIINYLKSTWGAQKNDYYSTELDVLNNISNSDTPVYFDTGGDETYIRKVDDKIIICTTQNADFEKIRENALGTNDISEEFYRKFDFITDDEYKEEFKPNDPSDFNYYYPKFNDFLILQHNFYGRHTYINNCTHCKQRFSRGWILKNGKTACGCQIDRIIRKEKLNKIKKRK